MRLAFLLTPVLLVMSADTADEARKEIVAAYQRSIDALRLGDADGAMQIETPDWVSITVGQAPRTRQEMEPYIRRDIESMKPPPGWVVEWRPDYEHSGTITGIQIYDVKLAGSEAIVLCLVGSTTRGVWTGSHVRDTWIKTSAGWKRRKHEKLTVNERMVDGRPAGR